MEEKSNSKFYQKWWFWAIIAFFGLGAIGYALNPDAYKSDDASLEEESEGPTADSEQKEDESPVVEYVGKYDSDTIQGEIESIVARRIADKMHSWVAVDSISVNDDLGTEVPDDYVVLVYTTWLKDDADRNLLEESISLYCSDIAAYAVEKYPQVQEITVFWMIPSLSDKTNSAKCNYEQTDGAMYLSNTFGIIMNKMTNGELATKVWKDTL